MKKDIVSHGMFIFLSLIFCAIQSNFYFLFFPIPQIWFIIPNYYSLTKSLSFSIACNFFISLVVVQFSVAPFYSILSSTNLITLMLYLFRTRFHMEFWHMSLSGGWCCSFFYILLGIEYFVPRLLPPPYLVLVKLWSYNRAYGFFSSSFSIVFG